MPPRPPESLAKESRPAGADVANGTKPSDAAANNSNHSVHHQPSSEQANSLPVAIDLKLELERPSSSPIHDVAIVGNGKTSLRRIRAEVDSGAVCSLTPDASSLINTRPCNEVFRAADGSLSPCTSIGDLPTIVRSRDGLRRVVFENVRHVPNFKFTLLSVKQLWREQRIDSRFADINALVASTGRSALRIPFEESRDLPSVALILTASAPDTPWLSGIPSISKETASPPAEAPKSSSPSVDPNANQNALPKAALAASLGFHRVGTSSHVGRLSAAQAAELLHRRSHAGIDKIRATANTTTDAPKVLASASAPCTCIACALARIRRAPHSGTLDAPAPEPGTLHVDLKELVLSREGYRYVVFAIDEHSRFVWVEFIKLKSEVVRAIMLIRAAFLASVATPIDSDGNPLPRPSVRIVHSDREGGLISNSFRDFRAESTVHHTTSPPHDHDLSLIHI